MSRSMVRLPHHAGLPQARRPSALTPCNLLRVPYSPRSQMSIRVDPMPVDLHTSYRPLRSVFVVRRNASQS